MTERSAREPVVVALLTEGWLYKLYDKVARKKGLVEDRGSWKSYYFYLKRLPSSVQIELHKKRPGLITENPDRVISLTLYKVSKKKLSDSAPEDQQHVCEIDILVNSTVEYLAFFTETQRDKFVFYLMTNKKLSLQPAGLTYPVIPTNCESNQKICACGSNCLLQVFPWGITLALKPSRAVLAQWPLSSIRWYDYSSNNFQFQAGRRAPMGQGQYTFEVGTGLGKKLYSFLDDIVVAETEKRVVLDKYNASPVDDAHSDQCFFSQIASLPPEMQHVMDLKRVSQLNFGPESGEPVLTGADQAAVASSASVTIPSTRTKTNNRERRKPDKSTLSALSVGSTDSGGGGLYVDMRKSSGSELSSPINASADNLQSFPTEVALHDFPGSLSSPANTPNQRTAPARPNMLPYGEISAIKSWVNGQPHGQSPLSSPNTRFQKASSFSSALQNLSSPSSSIPVIHSPQGADIPTVHSSTLPRGEEAPADEAPALPPFRKGSLPSDNPLYRSITYSPTSEPVGLYENTFEMSGDFGDHTSTEPAAVLSPAGGVIPKKVAELSGAARVNGREVSYHRVWRSNSGASKKPLIKDRAIDQDEDDRPIESVYVYADPFEVRNKTHHGLNSMARNPPEPPPMEKCYVPASGTYEEIDNPRDNGLSSSQTLSEGVDSNGLSASPRSGSFTNGSQVARLKNQEGRKLTRGITSPDLPSTAVAGATAGSPLSKTAKKLASLFTKSSSSAKADKQVSQAAGSRLSSSIKATGKTQVFVKAKSTDLGNSKPSNSTPGNSKPENSKPMEGRQLPHLPGGTPPS